MTETINTIAIPLNRLVPGAENVRRTGRTVSIGELTASILAHGLRQNLNVRATEDGRYAVVAGSRRLRALKQLAEAKHLPKSHPVPYRVLTEDEDAGEIPLAENVCPVLDDKAGRQMIVTIQLLPAISSTTLWRPFSARPPVTSCHGVVSRPAGARACDRFRA